jgi:hypothetical protein
MLFHDRTAFGQSTTPVYLRVSSKGLINGAAFRSKDALHLLLAKVFP